MTSSSIHLFVRDVLGRCKDNCFLSFPQRNAYKKDFLFYYLIYEKC